MTNDDLKRFYPTNSTLQRREDFVRYGKNAEIEGLASTDIDILNVQLEHLIISHYIA